MSATILYIMGERNMKVGMIKWKSGFEVMTLKNWDLQLLYVEGKFKYLYL